MTSRISSESKMFRPNNSRPTLFAGRFGARRFHALLSALPFLPTVAVILLLAALAALATPGCHRDPAAWSATAGAVGENANSEGAGGGAATEQLARPIYQGVVDADPAHAAVVALTYGPGSGSFCTGTLVAPGWVLTAGHCVESNDAAWVQVFFGSDAMSGGTFVPAAELIAHPSYDPQTLENDVALVRLAAAAPAGVAPIPPLPASLGITAADLGFWVDFSGFGLTETGTKDLKLAVSRPIGLVCPGPGFCWAELGDGTVGQVNPRAFAYEQSGGGPCRGDSGGPAFILRGGREYVAGVTSYGDDACLAFGVSTQVDAFEAWIQGHLSGSPSTPGSPGTPGTGPAEDCSNGADDDGDGATDCADPDCADSPACQPGDDPPLTCETVATLACGDRVLATTVGRPERVSYYDCAPDDSWLGPESAFQIAAPAGSTVTVTLEPVDAVDLDLILLATAGTGCAPDRCLGGSLNVGVTAEQLSYMTEAAGSIVVVESWDLPGRFHLSVACQGGAVDDPYAPAGPAPEHCANGVDDDRDGYADCADPDCWQSQLCQPGALSGGGDDSRRTLGCQQSSDGPLPLWPAVLAGVLLFARRRRRRHAPLTAAAPGVPDPA